MLPRGRLQRLRCCVHVAICVGPETAGTAAIDPGVCLCRARTEVGSGSWIDRWLCRFRLPNRTAVCRKPSRVWLSWTWHGWTCHADVRRQGQENAAIPLVLCFQSAEPAPRAGVTRRPLGWDRDGGQGQEEGSNVGGPSVPKTFRAFSTRSAVADGFNRNMRRRPKKAKLCTMCRTRYVVPISPFRTCPGGSTTGI